MEIDKFMLYGTLGKNNEKSQSVKYYDFKHPSKISDDDLELNEIFGIVLAENLSKELKKKFCNHIKNLKTKFLIVDEFTFGEFYKSMPDYSPITSFYWNKNEVLFEFDSDINCELLKNFIQINHNDFNNREMTDTEINLYKKNIESSVFNALSLSCKKNKSYNGNSIKKSLFTKKELNINYNYDKNHSNKDNECGCFFTIEISFETSENFIVGNFNLLLDWKIAKQIADNIAGKKKKQKKFFTNNQTDEKKCFVEAKLGNTTMSLSDVKDINKGTIIDLDKNAFEPITIYVDGKEFAKGEVVVRSKNNNFSLRVTELL